MKPASSTPTLLVFTLGPAGEGARRSLLPGSMKGMEIGLRQACLAAALEAGRTGGLRVEVCAPARPVLPEGTAYVPQEGADFGARLEGALAGAFARSGGPVVVVGTDVPGLAPRHLQAALASLSADDRRVVVGPSPDGGFYLLAAARPLPALAGVRWCRRATLRQLRRALAEAGREVVLIEPLADLDRPADLDHWLAGGGEGAGWALVTTLLRRALAERRRPVPAPPTPARRSSLSPRLSGRAPPSRLDH